MLEVAWTRCRLDWVGAAFESGTIRGARGVLLAVPLVGLPRISATTAAAQRYSGSPGPSPATETHNELSPAPNRTRAWKTSTTNVQIAAWHCAPRTRTVAHPIDLPFSSVIPLLFDRLRARNPLLHLVLCALRSHLACSRTAVVMRCAPL